MNTYTLGYGSQSVDITINGANSVEVLNEKPLDEITDLHATFLRAVETDMVASPALRELIAPTDLVTIVVSDITRFWMRQDLVTKELVNYLHDIIGVPYDNIAAVIALGTHRSASTEEHRRLVSEEIYEKIKVYNHDCLADDLVYLGTTSFGTEVRVNSLAVGRKVILIGGTVHHLMSGFGGGRKSVLPGISAKSTILQNHLHCLSPDESCSNPLIGMAKLENNPVHEDMTEAAAMVNPAFGINIVSNSKGKQCRLICGNWKLAWEESCRIVHEHFGVPIEKKADIVIASCGGFPKDINLYQGVKSLLNAGQAVKDGGTILFLAECREGGGSPDFFGWIQSVITDTLDADLRANFSIGGYIFYAACEVIRRCHVRMLTEIPADTIRDMKIEAYRDIEELLKGVDFEGKDVYVMPYGGYTMPYLRK
ncbi:MAG: nickel-dependent lactate racemase [Lachnospiraceae bacterium]|nr:nickel-dependent lactate racemase [Lachnospiraceae bacterium]